MNWSKLSHLQLGKYGEYFAKMEFTKYGFDVYTAEVDDKGIDFVIRNKNNNYFEIQVKSVRGKNYVFMRKEVFKPKDNLYLALLMFEDDKEPSFILIPSTKWLDNSVEYFVERTYNNLKSKPEYGIKFNNTSLSLLKSEYSFLKQVSQFNL